MLTRRVPGDDADIGAGKDCALGVGLVGEPAHADLATAGSREVVANGLVVLVGHDRQTHGHELGLGHRLAPAGALGDCGGVVDELAGLQVSGTGVVVAHHRADVVDDGLHHRGTFVVVVLVEELVAQQGRQAAPGKAAVVNEVAALPLHRTPPF